MSSPRIPRRPISGSHWATRLVIVLSLALAAQLVFQELKAMWQTKRPGLLFALIPTAVAPSAVAQSVDLSWHAPSQTSLNNLSAVLNSHGVYGFIYNSSITPDAQYGTYNWCNMPHVRRQEYARPPDGFDLVYVELIHRHHKRTPYSSNAFPVESYHWDCGDQGLYYFGQSSPGPETAQGFWQGYLSPVNPFVPQGWVGTCQFPQITSGGLTDSWQHGADLYAVYHDLLGFLPGRLDDWRSRVAYRVTQNVITSQVAGMVVSGMWATADPVPLVIEAANVDSLEPQYSCPAANNVFSSIKSSSAWNGHLDAAKSLYATLDDISGVSPSDGGFHASFDHYYDNLSARQCHAKPLPCKLVNGANSSTCVTQDLADAVYRMGNWEYNQIYRGDPQSLAAGVGSYGVWVAELAAHLRAAMAGQSRTIWYHNMAHDGSVSRLLAVLQIDVMVWPGMGSEVVFELWKYSRGARCRGQQGSNRKRDGGFCVRVLFGGKVLKSSNPSLGAMDMIAAETLLAYFDGLVGQDASLMLGKCAGSTPL